MRIRTAGLAVAIAFLSLAAASTAATFYTASDPLSEAEIYSFLLEEDTAFRTCDAEWIAHHHVPGATYSYEIPGQAPVVERIDDLLVAFRKGCSPRYERVSFSRRGWRVTVRGFQATVHRQDSRGPMGYFATVYERVRADADQVDRVETFETLIRGSAGQIQVKSVRWIVTLRSQR